MSPDLLSDPLAYNTTFSTIMSIPLAPPVAPIVHVTLAGPDSSGGKHDAFRDIPSFGTDSSDTWSYFSIRMTAALNAKSLLYVIEEGATVADEAASPDDSAEATAEKRKKREK
ncbi:hypothetical protein HDU67_005397 [Dinochytrium kinnereticum]|nr:hypothetical protein HDU67_005397 [Dinochytrium kinnereticum]